MKEAADCIVIEVAVPSDLPAVKSLVDAAYSKYISRIGKPLAPMSTDYSSADVITSLYVLKKDSQAVGAIVIYIDTDNTALTIDCIVVDPAMQGHEYGKKLMAFAEQFAKRNGCGAITLYTNELMFENLTIYEKMGFKETDQRSEHGYKRVFLRKTLNSECSVIPSQLHL